MTTSNKPVQMAVTIIINGKQVTQADIRHFIQKVREWELTTPKGEIEGIKIQTDPQLSPDEVKAIFRGVFQEFKDMVEVPVKDPGHLRLGRRAVCIEGIPIGLVQEMELSIGASTDEVNQKLQQANIIQLVKVKGEPADLADRMLKTLKEE